MAWRNLCLFLAVALLAFSCFCDFAIANSTNHTTTQIPNTKTKHYCVAVQSAPLNKLYDFMGHVCKAFDCSAVEPNGPCYRPANVLSHSSYMLNIVYKKTHRCVPMIGARTSNDPSYGNCHYA